MSLGTPLRHPLCLFRRATYGFVVVAGVVAAGAAGVAEGV